MKTIATAASAIAILCIAAWAAAPATQPTASGAASGPGRQNEIDLRVVATTTWAAPDGKEGVVVPLTLKIVNRTGRGFQFNLFDTITVHVKDAAGKELTLGGGRDRSAVPPPLFLDRGEEGSVDLTAKLERTGKGYRLNGPDGAGGWWWFDGLAEGKYTVSIAYANTQAQVNNLPESFTAGKAPFWIGQASTKEVAIEIVGKPAASRPATRP